MFQIKSKYIYKYTKLNRCIVKVYGAVLMLCYKLNVDRNKSNEFSTPLNDFKKN